MLLETIFSIFYYGMRMKLFNYYLHYTYLSICPDVFSTGSVNILWPPYFNLIMSRTTLEPNTHLFKFRESCQRILYL